MKKFGQSLDKIVAGADQLKQLRKQDLQVGDLVIITTRNSEYRIRTLEDGFYQVSGGWFVRQGMSPIKLKIAGCTWGGSIIKADVVAACGLCLEFGNRLITSPIKKFWVVPYSAHN
ncbi:MAG: hypothetical protein ACE5IY_07700 [bacterium]